MCVEFQDTRFFLHQISTTLSPNGTLLEEFFNHIFLSEKMQVSLQEGCADLERERFDLVVHDLGKAEGQHEQHQQLPVHGAQGHPQMGAGERKEGTTPPKKIKYGCTCQLSNISR